MKQALLAGIYACIDDWLRFLKQSSGLFALVLTATFAQSVLLYEILAALESVLPMRGYYISLTSYWSGDEFSTFQWSNYLSYVVNSAMFDLFIVNSFLLGVYYSSATISKNNLQIASTDLLDSPVEDNVVSLASIFAVIEREEWIRYALSVAWLLIAWVMVEIISTHSYDFIGTSSYLFFFIKTRVPYLILIGLYWYWLKLPSWNNLPAVDRSVLVIFLLFIFPAIVYYFQVMLLNGVHTLLTTVGIQNMWEHEIVGSIAFLILMLLDLICLPLIVLFYSKSLKTLAHEYHT